MKWSYRGTLTTSFIITGRMYVGIDVDPEDLDSRTINQVLESLKDKHIRLTIEEL
jgi:hypothetical protein